MKEKSLTRPENHDSQWLFVCNSQVGIFCSRYRELRKAYFSFHEEVLVSMKRFAMVLAVVGMVMLFASYGFSFYAWAPYAGWGAASSSSSSSGYWPASSSSSGYAWPASSSSSGTVAYCCVPASGSSSSSSSGYYWPSSGSSSSSSGYYWPSSSSSSGYWPSSGSSSGWY